MRYVNRRLAALDRAIFCLSYRPGDNMNMRIFVYDDEPGDGTGVLDICIKDIRIHNVELIEKVLAVIEE